MQSAADPQLRKPSRRTVALLRRPGLVLALCVVLGGGLRWVAMEATFPQTLIGDERYYFHVAYNIAQGEGHRAAPAERAFRPPAASFLYSLFIDPDLPREPVGLAVSLRTLTELQVAIGTLLVGITGLLGWVCFGPTAGVLVAALAAVHPTLIIYSQLLWSENLFALLLTVALAAAVSGQRRDSTLMAALCGLVFGVASLTRETAVALSGVAALWWAWSSWSRDRQRGVLQGAVLLAVAAAVVLPWTYRNYQVFGRFVPIATVSWYSAGAGNALDSPDWYAPPNERRAEYKRLYASYETEMERYDFARNWTLQEIRNEQPTWILKKSIRNLSLLFNPDSTLFYKMRLSAYGDPPTLLIRALAVVSVAFSAAMIVGAVLGIAGAPPRAAPVLALGMLAMLAAGHVFAIANTRHRMPLEPLLLVYASYAALEWRGLVGRMTRRSKTLAGLALGFFFLVCVPYFFFYSHTAAVWSGVQGF